VDSGICVEENVVEERMFKRILALLLLAWLLGFAWFALLLPQAAPLSKTDAVVVLTGGPNRIDRALAVMEAGDAKRMLISGVAQEVKPAELAAQYHRTSKLFDCCIDLGFQAVDTRSNALETARWVTRYKIKSIRLVTHDWHMRRARLELDKALPGNMVIINDAVATQPSLTTLFIEYNKYCARGFAWVLGM
jgi:uncharacterized SAM-binding protein YcdF (DUF218 family)